MGGHKGVISALFMKKTRRRYQAILDSISTSAIHLNPLRFSHISNLPGVFAATIASSNPHTIGLIRRGVDDALFFIRDLNNMLTILGAQRLNRCSELDP
jgi:hypothetical protein